MSDDGRTLVTRAILTATGASMTPIQLEGVSATFDEDTDRIPFVQGTVTALLPDGFVTISDPYFDVREIWQLELALYWSDGGDEFAAWNLLVRAIDADPVAGTLELTVASTDLILLRPLPIAYTADGTLTINGDLMALCTAYGAGIFGATVIVGSPAGGLSVPFAAAITSQPPTTGAQLVEAIGQAAGAVFRCHRNGWWEWWPRVPVSQAPAITYMTARPAWADFEREYAGLTWAQFEAATGGLTWGAFEALFAADPNHYTEGHITGAHYGGDLDDWANVVAITFSDDPGVVELDYTSYVVGAWGRTFEQDGTLAANGTGAHKRAANLRSRLDRNGQLVTFELVIDPRVPESGSWVRFLVRDEQADRQVQAIRFDTANHTMTLTARPAQVEA